MALKPIEPGAEADEAERKAHKQALEQSRGQPHLWGNGPEHQMQPPSAAQPAVAGGAKK